MAKNNSSMNLLFVIGLAVTAIGFLLPIFKVSFGPFSGSTNGFDLVGKGDSIMKIAALLVFVGAIAGIVFNFLNVGSNQKLFMLVALIVSIVGGLYCFFNTSSTAHNILFKIVSVGFWMIVAGWVIAIIGYVTNK